ncbi:MAG: hypothetical protein JSR85_05825 [Proteobacteria bacterium]|nr:hypothetical protein [Pseudomonadota bacterium]
MHKSSVAILGLFCLSFMMTTVWADTIVCPTPGDVVDPKTNMCLQEALTTPECKTGYVWVKSVRACAVCPAGYHYVNGQCVPN